MSDLRILRSNACRNCRRPVYLVEGVGWMHGELPQYAHEPMTCSNPHPVDDEDYRIPGEKP